MKLKKKHMWYMLIMYILAGALNTIFLRLQNFEKSLGVNFKHTWFVTQLMFIGEFDCLLLYIIIKIIKPAFNMKDERGLDGKIKTPPPKYMYIGPAFLELFSITLSLFALLNLPVTVYAMLKGGKLFFKAIISSIILKHRLHRHHIFSLIMIFIGMVLVGLSKVLAYSGIEADPTKNEAIGYISLFLYFLLGSVQFILEENIMLKYHAHPLEVAGWQGFIGGIISLVLMIIFQQIYCEGFHFRKDICSIDNLGDYRIENSFFAIQQMFSNLNIILLQIGYIISVCFENVIGTSITKFESSMERSIYDNLKPILVWIFFISVPTQEGEKFRVLQVIGFIILTVGSLIYNELIEIPCFNLNHHTNKSKMSRREMESEMMGDLKQEMFSMAMKFK